MIFSHFKISRVQGAMLELRGEETILAMAKDPDKDVLERLYYQQVETSLHMLAVAHGVRCRRQMALLVWRVPHQTWPTCSVRCERCAQNA